MAKRADKVRYTRIYKYLFCVSAWKIDAQSVMADYQEVPVGNFSATLEVLCHTCNAGMPVSVIWSVWLLSTFTLVPSPHSLYDRPPVFWWTGEWRGPIPKANTWVAMEEEATTFPHSFLSLRLLTSLSSRPPGGRYLRDWCQAAGGVLVLISCNHRFQDFIGRLGLSALVGECCCLRCF